MTVHEIIRNLESQIKTLPEQDFSYRNLENATPQTQHVKNYICQQIASYSCEFQKRILDEIDGHGPIVELIANENITEIIINGPDSLWYELNGTLAEHNDFFSSELSFNNFIQRLCLEAKSHYTLEHPMADGKLHDFRVHIVSEELTRKYPVVSLRRHPKNPWTLSKLVEQNWAGIKDAEAIYKIIQEHENFIIIGATGSGKTSLLNACMQCVNPNCRTIIIEDTEELTLPNAVSTRLLTRKDSQNVLNPIDQTELLKQSLRMRPDRIVMGEIRGSEAKDLLMALSTGHRGSFASLHATDAHQALLRLEMLIQLGAPNWSLDAIRNLIFLSLQKIIVVEREHDGQRKLKGIYQLCSRESSGILIDRCS